jgi:hypothetical protein
MTDINRTATDRPTSPSSASHEGNRPRRPQLQCQRGNDFEAGVITTTKGGVKWGTRKQGSSRLDVQPDLFGGFGVVKEWGRIGAHGRMVASGT